MKDGPRWPPDLIAVLSLVVVFSVLVLCVGLGGDYPLNDDWAYADSARHFAKTGQLRILDWAAPGLLGHVLWGAALLRWLGDSYVVLRGGTLVFALGGVLLCYALARQSGLGARRAVLTALGLGLSPWYVNLSFTYMTDVPWLTLMLGALCCALAALPPHGPRPRPALLLLSGALIGAAALTRQFAVITTPAFVVHIALDARRREGTTWRAAAAATARASLLLLPVALLFVPFQLWYTRVHTPTAANRETWQRMLEVGWHPIEHAFVLLHYFGFFLAPIALCWALARERLPLSRRARNLVLAALVGYALFKAAFEGWYTLHPGLRPARRHLTMPYLDNVFYLLGLGPPTIYDLYSGVSPMLHDGRLLGVLLTLISVVSGVWAAALLWPPLREAARGVAALRRPEAPSPPVRRVQQALLLGFGACYLLWHLCTGPFIFDRYLLPVIPIVWIVALQEHEAGAQEGWAPLWGIAIIGILSLIGTREYMAWNGARDRLVRALEARGVPAEDIDGGFEVNGPRRFAAFFRRTGKLFEDDGSWWGSGASHRISLWPPQSGLCQTLAEESFWSVPAPKPIYVLRCHGLQPFQRP